MIYYNEFNEFIGEWIKYLNSKEMSLKLRFNANSDEYKEYFKYCYPDEKEFGVVKLTDKVILVVTTNQTKKPIWYYQNANGKYYIEAFLDTTLGTAKFYANLARLLILAIDLSDIKLRKKEYVGYMMIAKMLSEFLKNENIMEDIIGDIEVIKTVKEMVSFSNIEDIENNIDQRFIDNLVNYSYDEYMMKLQIE